jgi:hypothetical protein
MMEKVRRDRRDKEEGHLANKIRRKMLQKDHGDNSKYSRKKYKKINNYEFS